MGKSWWVLGIAALASSACGESNTDASDGDDGNGGAATGGSASGTDGGDGGSTDPAPHGSKITAVSIEIDYARGAAPDVASGLGGRSPFDLSQANLERLFSGKELTLPRTLDAMEEIDDVAEGPYTIDDIVALAAAHRDQESSDTTASYYAIWLDGYYVDPSTEMENRNVLGVSIGGTSVVAMFKPVIESASGGLLGNSSSYVEQTTFIHEIGHAAGLVDNGIALQSAHRDDEHGRHCSNPDCVMYYLNEGGEAMRDYIGRMVSNESTILFDDACLADVDAANAD